MKGKCGKRRYRTELDAKIALWSTSKARNEEKRKENRHYYHKACKGWHITSMTQEEYDAQVNSSERVQRVR